MAASRKLTPLEWEIMDVIWHLGGSPSVRDVLEQAYPDGSKAYTTLQTVMNNLKNKGFLRTEKIGLVNFYTPLKMRNEVVPGETKRFVERVFEGSFGALAHYLIRTDALTDAEIRDLQRLVDARTSPSDPNSV